MLPQATPWALESGMLREVCLGRRKTRVARERRPDDDGMARGLARSLGGRQRHPPIKAALCVIWGPCL